MYKQAPQKNIIIVNTVRVCTLSLFSVHKMCAYVYKQWRVLLPINAVGRFHTCKIYSIIQCGSHQCGHHPVQSSSMWSSSSSCVLIHVVIGNFTGYDEVRSHCGGANTPITIYMYIISDHVGFTVRLVRLNYNITFSIHVRLQVLICTVILQHL